MRSKKKRARRVGRNLLLGPTTEPVDAAAWLAKLDEYFMPEGRQQPLMPPPHEPFP
jgi:virulence-associated protein VagC